MHENIGTYLKARQMDKVELYGGFLADERCIILVQWTEQQVLETFARAKEHARRTDDTLSESVRRAIGVYQSWGVREEEKLRAALVKARPSVEKFLRYAVLRYARCLVEQDTAERFEVRAVMPNSGSFLRDVHIAVGRSYDFENPRIVEDPLRRKLALHDCIRQVIGRYVHQVDGTAADASVDPLLHGLTETVDDVSPDDSISQVASPASPSSAPHRAPSSTGSAAPPAAATGEGGAPPEAVRRKPTDSLFRQNVAARLQEMADPPGDKPLSFAGAPSETHKGVRRQPI